VSEHNRLDDGRYYDIESKSSWEFDHASQVCSPVVAANLNVTLMSCRKQAPFSLTSRNQNIPT
jgi:hypothetical protein